MCIRDSLCTGDSVLAGGAYQTLSGTFYDSLSSMAGCDSVIETVLTVSSQITVNIFLSECYGDSALINGNYELASGTFYDTATSVLGCDSITITNFIVDSLITNSVIASICQGDGIILSGSYQTAAGNYVDTLSSANGCDSILTTTLIVNPIVTNNLTASICQGDSLLVGGSYQTAAGSYIDTLLAVNGCDSIVNTVIDVIDVNINQNDTSICFGDSINLNLIELNGWQWVTQEDTNIMYWTTIPSSPSPSSCCGALYVSDGFYNPDCNSSLPFVIEFDQNSTPANITLGQPIAGFSIAPACNSGAPNLTGNYYYLSNYTATWSEADSICNVLGGYLVTITSVDENNFVANIDNCLIGQSAFWIGLYDYSCNPQSNYLWSTGETTESIIVSPNQTTTYYVNETQNGVSCTDSVTITVYQPTYSTSTVTECDTYTWNGTSYTASGVYTFASTNANGCDSTATLNLTINPTITNSVTASLCNGDSLLVGGEYQTLAGSYDDVYSSNSGCDSIVTTTLTVNPTIINSVTASICNGDSLLVGGAYQTLAGNYDDVYSSNSGCDSIVTTALTVSSAITGIDIQQAVCDFIWINGVTYNTSDSTSSFTLSSVSGCDSIVTLNLTISPLVTTIVQNGNDIEASVVNGTAPYTYLWSTGETNAIITPSANGLYSVVVSDADSCLSDTAIFLVEFVNTTGIENWSNSVSIYPNPTSDILTISIGNYSGLITTNVYDLFGRKIIITNEKEVSLKAFADGVYILELTAGNYSYTTRIVKE